MINYFRIAAFLFLITVSAACQRHNSNLRITVKESDVEYRFSAEFDHNKMAEVQQFLNKSASPVILFKSDTENVDTDKQLPDNTKLNIRSAPGELLISVDKRSNNEASVQQIRKMCEGVKAIIGG